MPKVNSQECITKFLQTLIKVLTLIKLVKIICAWEVTFYSKSKIIFLNHPYQYM